MQIAINLMIVHWSPNI